MTTNLLTLIKLRLTLDDRWAVGTWPHSKDTVQLPVLLDPRPRTDGAHRPYLPGTSLVGSLRRHLRQQLGQTATIGWLGPEPGEREVRTGALSQSAAERLGRLVVLGCLPIDAPVHFRGTTKIDLTRGAAHGTSQRTEEFVEPGTVTVVLQHEGEPDEAFLGALAGWRPIVGRARTSGMGRARVTDLRWLGLDLDDAKQFTWWLLDRDSWLRAAGGAPAGAVTGGGATSTERSAPTRSWRLTAAEPIHVGTGDGPQPQDDGRNATLGLKVSDTLVIPGSTWKGVFRHRAEVILNAVGATDEQRIAIVDHWFGAQGGRGRLRFRDTVTTVQAGSLRTHVAIDRFTGGARTGALHRVEAIPQDTALDVGVDIVGDPDAIGNLLEHVVADLDAGLCTVGGHGTRGYGWVKRTGKPTELHPVVVTDLLPAASTTEGEVAS